VSSWQKGLAADGAASAVRLNEGAAAASGLWLQPCPRFSLPTRSLIDALRLVIASTHANADVRGRAHARQQPAI
jgi:hypothetical protein